MKKILLIGIHGTYNYGCEAIVRGTVNQIRLQFPNAIIDYASVRKEDDTQRLVGSSVNVICLETKGIYSVSNIFRKLLSLVNYTYEYSCFDNIENLIKGYDAVFSIGGDIYTLMPNGGFSTNLSYIGNKCYKAKIPYIIWGCSIGPFSKNPNAAKYYTRHLKKVTRIVAREKETIEYLKSLGVTQNVIFAPDPAFYVVPMAQRKNITISDVKKIGLNLSPHSAHYHYSNILQTIEFQANEIDKFIEKSGCDVVLLPHVYSQDLNDDDNNYLHQILARVRNLSKISIVDEDPGFLGLKEYIKECDIVISARMHCNINAITCGVPTIFLAYSQKAKGMVDYVYCDKGLLMDIKDFNSDSLLEKISLLLQNRYNVKAAVEAYEMKGLIANLIK